MDLDELLLYQDDRLLAVNKPAGLRAIADGYRADLPHLAGLLQAHFGRVWVVHRLDKDTSGVMLFARDAEAHRALNDQFARRAVRKQYHAIASGLPETDSLEIDLPLRVNGDRQHRTVIDHQRGKPAATIVRLLEALGVFSLLEAEPHTGYTHQIRAHLAALGLPLLADPLYRSRQPDSQASRIAAAAAPSLPIQRTALHACQIVLQHPASGAPLAIQAPYPADFTAALDALRALRDAG